MTLKWQTFHCTNFTLVPDIILNTKQTKKKKKFGSHNGFVTQCISAKTQNQIDHCDETREECSGLIPHCKLELKETTSWTTVGQAKDIASSPNEH